MSSNTKWPIARLRGADRKVGEGQEHDFKPAMETSVPVL